MKKFLWLISVAIVAFFYSCKEQPEKHKSFSEIIKEDTSRKSELMHVADSLMKTGWKESKKDSSNNLYIDDYKITNTQKSDWSLKANEKILIIDPPKILMSAKDLNDLVYDNGGDMQSDQDSLIFTPAMYRKDADISAYKKRRHQEKVAFKDLGGRLTLVVELKTNSLTISPAYDPGRLCPPPLSCNAYQ